MCKADFAVGRNCMLDKAWTPLAAAAGSWWSTEKVCWCKSLNRRSARKCTDQKDEAGSGRDAAASKAWNLSGPLSQRDPATRAGKQVWTVGRYRC